SCWQTVFDADAGADAFTETKADETGRGEDDGVVLAGIELGQTGVDVAAQELNLQIRAARQQLRLTPQAGSTDDRSRRQCIEILEAIGNKGVAGIFTFADAVQAEPFGELHR